MILLSSLDFSLPLQNPVIIFSLVLFIILFAPILLNKIKVPHIIGLIVAGVIVGPYGLNLLKRDSSIVLFGTVGLLYIMFLAGLEIDLAEFKKNRKRILVFGLFTFVFPLVFGSLASYYLLGYGFLSSLLLASMFSTHTLVSYPIASKYGVIRNRAVSMTVGGTMITDILALLILAGIAGMTKESVSPAFWLQLGGATIVFVTIVFAVFPIIIRWFFKHFEDSVSQYIFVLAMVFLASFLAEAAGIEAIIGAFFSGLVLNKFVPHTSPLMNRIDFVGNALFIPFFLISVGMLVDVTVLVKGWGALKVAGVIIAVAVATKYLAAWLTQKIFKLSATEGTMIFGLSSSHAAATLAIILVGYNIITGETAAGEPIRLLNEDVLNGTILLILVSCGVSSFVVEGASKKLALEQDAQDATPLEEQTNEKILVTLAYPDMVTQLVDFGMMLKSKKTHTSVYGLNVIADEQVVDTNAGTSKKILEKAISHAAASENSLIPVTRYDSSISNGIVYTIKEHGVSDIVIGMHKQADQHTFLGTKAENIIKRIHETIYIYKPTQPLNTFKRVVVAIPPKAETEPGFLHWLKKLMAIAKEATIPVNFYGTAETNEAIGKITERTSATVKIQFTEFNNWDDFLIFSRELKVNDLFIIISSRKGHNSYIPQLNKLPYYLSNYFVKQSLIVLYPKQLELGINMGNIEQADSHFIETLSEQLGVIGKAGRYVRGLFKK
ncbi:Kef-type K+ transport system membrane component KefB [Pedobacter africanus]|uniref:Kef-type K+ transport system membrane component KefB n=1 Tax=Pedobacter africanus TaxID=151894 RepID=A0ACC6KWB1_9SPHI|nr:cation:proton antiporter [Pedobacter africanus]MDR6783413.1 Kef-type K+ transport system membrane component KefB [Pedobacter africanus]